jgi:hypothetical protein
MRHAAQRIIMFLRNAANRNIKIALDWGMRYALRILNVNNT